MPSFDSFAKNGCFSGPRPTGHNQEIRIVTTHVAPSPEPIAGHLMWQQKAIFRAFRWPANWNLAHRVRGLGDMTSRAWAARMPHAESRQHLLWKTSPG